MPKQSETGTVPPATVGPISTLIFVCVTCASACPGGGPSTSPGDARPDRAGDAAAGDSRLPDAGPWDDALPDRSDTDASGTDAMTQVDVASHVDAATPVDAAAQADAAPDACSPSWVDISPCDCSPDACSGCSGTKQQSDGCGHNRQVTCSLPASGCPAGQTCDSQGLCVIQVTNPVLSGDHPDPDVLRLESNGQVTYYLVHTIGTAGDIPVWTSHDLVHWTRLAAGAFAQASQPGTSLDFPNGHFCSIWAPDLTQISQGVFSLSFTATRWADSQANCPATQENSGVYLASSSLPTGPFATSQHPWEPFPAGANQATCPAATRDALPHSLDQAAGGCQGNFCHKIIRLDSDTFHDPVTGTWWLSYAWYTNIPPLVSWEETNHGEHSSIVQLDANDPFAVPCDENTPQIFLANCHDQQTINRLSSYCPRCSEMLSFTRGRFGEEVVRDGYSWGVAEGPNLFRRDNYVYALISGSLWDSPYYHVFWVAAPTVPELAYTNQNRLVGRFLIPSRDQAFGHGTAVLGPDGHHWYFVHHRLDSQACQDSGDCSRDLWITPIRFEDHGDGLGDVYIRAVFPAEHPTVAIVQAQP